MCCFKIGESSNQVTSFSKLFTPCITSKHCGPKLTYNESLKVSIDIKNVIILPGCQ